jgi:hypothetical protein
MFNRKFSLAEVALLQIATSVTVAVISYLQRPAPVVKEIFTTAPEESQWVTKLPPIVIDGNGIADSVSPSHIVINESESRYDRCLAYALMNEGGLSEDKRDSGGTTKAGISLRMLLSIPLSEADINNDGVINAKDIYALQPEDWKRLYRKYFYDKLVCDDVGSERVAIKLFDSATNLGVRQATVIVQRVLGVRQDGIFGPATLAALNRADENTFLGKYVVALLGFYDKCVRAKPSNIAFLKGWQKRARKLPS